MSFQAYLDNIEEKTGKTPNQFIAEAKQKNITQHKDIIDWLKKDYGLGLGHARALAYVIQHGPDFEVRQTTGTHRDASGTLKLDGKSRKENDLPAKLGAPAERALAGPDVEDRVDVAAGEETPSLRLVQHSFGLHRALHRPERGLMNIDLVNLSGLDG